MIQTLPHLEIRLLGQFRVLQDGKEVAGFRFPKTRALFTLLVLAQGHAVEYEKLANDLWGQGDQSPASTQDSPATLSEQDPTKSRTSQAQDSVRQCLKRLQNGRSEKEAQAELRIDSRRFEKRTRNSVAFDLTNADIDVLKIEAAYQDRSSAARQQIIDWYRGELLPECLLPEIEERRLRLQSCYRSCLEETIQEARASGDFAKAIHLLQLRIANEPRREEWREQLMDLLIQCGEENAAREVYHRYIESLPPRSMPGIALQTKFAGLQTQRAKPQPHWTPAEFALLPDPLPQIVGRDKALLEIEALLDRARFVTLKGPPGVGKTLLALYAAARLAPNYNGKVLFIDLTAAHNLIDVQRRMCACLGAIPNQALSFEESLAQSIGLQRALIVLDNCEQIVPVSGPFLMDLLRRAPKLRVVATSQRAWRSFVGEHVYHVFPLKTPPAHMIQLSSEALMKAAPQFSSIQLFLNEIAVIQPSVRMTPQNVHTIVRIIAQLDGLPLAIKLAAGTSFTLTPEQILLHLERDLHILEDRTRLLPEKHRTLQVTIRLSYERLPDALQQLLRGVAVFRGGWTLEAAETVSRPLNITDLIQQLQERSLIFAEPVEGAMRFSMLETIHRFMLTRLSETQQFAATANRHLDYFLHLASEAEPHLTGPGQKSWLDRLRLERENFRQALDWALTSQRFQDGLRLAISLWRVWYTTGAYEEGYKVLQSFLSASPDIAPMLKLKALGASGNLAYQQADYANARLCFQDAIVLARQSGRIRAEANALGSLGNIASFEGHYTEAEKQLQAGLELFRHLEDARGIALVLGNLAANALRAQDYSQALDYCLQTVARMRSLGDPLNLAMALANLADVQIHADQRAAALAAVAEGLDLSAGLAHWRTIMQCHSLLLSLSIRQKAWNTAASLIGLRLALEKGTVLPTPRPELFDTYCADVETSLGGQAFAAALLHLASIAPEQCVVYMQAVCTNLKDSLRSEAVLSV